jgi:septal ring factor EnvC (AmiA/AmiB activator)
VDIDDLNARIDRHNGPGETKLIGLLIALGAVGLAAAAAVAAAEGAVWLTRELASRIVDYLRGEEAVLRDAIADKERELAEAQQRLERFDAAVDTIEGELEALPEKLAEVQDGIDEVEAEPKVEDKADAARERLVALIADLERAA